MNNFHVYRFLKKHNYTQYWIKYFTEAAQSGYGYKGGELLPKLQYYNYSSKDLYNAILREVQINFTLYYFNVIIFSGDVIMNSSNELDLFTLLRQTRYRAGLRIWTNPVSDS